MEDKQLVEIILKQVMEKLKSSQAEPKEAGLSEAEKPKVLILSEEHKTCCHEVLEHTDFTQIYQFECAMTMEYNCRIEDYEAVVLFSVSNINLGKLTAGIGDTLYLNLALQAILTGKKVYVPNEAVELFSYQAFAPKAFYSMMLEKIEFLKSCGLTFCELKDLGSALNTLKQEEEMGYSPAQVSFKKQAESKNNQQVHVLQDLKCTKQDVIIDKKVVTESDIKRAWEEGAVTVYTSDKAIISDLAKEFAKNRNILLKRSGL
ncbi:ethanolamine utilization protein [Anaerocolumna cellulosilytica]|uniref:Ethanolamine utilization protein n=1 Tax=Anaerocolumna cellulosilytica TaxID=433286 RepID=A0A6S6R689_9FIRM|nr:hypothetical protein [Anaerocolumna cellulosilytica]MBB5193812.1 ethanolamine utilization protein [Anaerocolumna cellulosilytica]BCJ94972.1 ethanolamine utilization protein [Anaerocolumna cellulosilytica]